MAEQDDDAKDTAEPTGHDRDDSSKTGDSKPLTSENQNKEEGENDQEGVQFDGLQDEDGKENQNKQSNNANEDPASEEKTTEQDEQQEDGMDVDDDDEKKAETTDCKGMEKLSILEQREEDKAEEKAPKLYSHTQETESMFAMDKAEEEKDRKREENDDPSSDQVQNDSQAKNNKVSFDESQMVPTQTAAAMSTETVFGKNDHPLLAGDLQEMPEAMEEEFRGEVDSEEVKKWLALCSETQGWAQELTEQLRLILEPTKQSKFQGDYKTGRKLSMKKVIPYIASSFRKDKIWLRRTKPSTRDYQIVLAVDDSSSMGTNEVKHTAFQSLATICQSLSTLDVGKLGILGFGTQSKLLHPLQSDFNPEDGAHLLKTLTFEQTDTNVSQMLGMTRKAFSLCSQHSPYRLALIISDGRGIFNEGKDLVQAAVRSAALEHIFMIFLIVENPEAKDSVLDIRSASFDANNKPKIVPYMEEFPFTYYMILKDIESLPEGLSDALRQWFTIVASSA